MRSYLVENGRVSKLTSQSTRPKKKQEKEKKDKKREKAIRIGKCTIGVGPIKERSFDYFNNITADYSEAKKMAAAEFLTGYLKFNHQDMSDINITDTKISGKKDDILYLVLDSPSKIKDIRRESSRLSEPRNKN